MLFCGNSLKLSRETAGFMKASLRMSAKWTIWICSQLLDSFFYLNIFVIVFLIQANWKRAFCNLCLSGDGFIITYLLHFGLLIYNYLGSSWWTSLFRLLFSIETLMWTTTQMVEDIFQFHDYDLWDTSYTSFKHFS